MRKRRKIPRPEIIFMTPELVRELLDTLEPHNQMQTMVACYIFGGFRREELLWLRNSDFDYEARQVRVVSKHDDDKLWVPKTNSARRVPISDDLMRFLEKYEPRVRSEWMFPSPQGKRWDADNFGAELKRLQRQYKIGRPGKDRLLP